MDKQIKYRRKSHLCYHSDRYNKDVVVPMGYPSDGATGAFDLKNSDSWWVHDKLCDTGVFEDGTPCTTWQASTICCDILASEGRWFRRFSWWLPTFIFGGGECQKN